jgi:hypothetical protein
MALQPPPFVTSFWVWDVSAARETAGMRRTRMKLVLIDFMMVDVWTEFGCKGYRIQREMIVWVLM